MDSEKRDELISNFIDVTSASLEVAIQYIEMCGGDVDQAICLYLESGPESRGPEMSNPKYQEPQVPSPVAAFDDRLYDFDLPAAPVVPTLPPHISRNIAILEPPGNNKDVQKSMFKIPSDILFHGDFEQAKDFGTENNKFLLLNIQNYFEFTSHTLDRDIWSNEPIQTFIRDYFVFLQREVSSPEGQQICSFYPEFENFPVVAIIHPKTGILMHKFTHPLTLVSVLDTIEQFIGRYPQVSFNAKRLHTENFGKEQQQQQSSNQQPQTKLQQATKDEPEIQKTSSATNSLLINEVIEPIALSPEPDVDDPSAIGIRFRLPNGSTVERRFSPSNTIQNALDYVSSVSTDKSVKYQLVSSWPKKVFSDGNQNLESCQLGKKALLIVEIVS